MEQTGWKGRVGSPSPVSKACVCSRKNCRSRFAGGRNRIFFIRFRSGAAAGCGSAVRCRAVRQLLINDVEPILRRNEHGERIWWKVYCSGVGLIVNTVFFLPHDARSAKRPSVCPSVCPTVTLTYCGRIGWASSNIITRIISLASSHL